MGYMSQNALFFIISYSVLLRSDVGRDVFKITEPVKIFHQLRLLFYCPTSVRWYNLYANYSCIFHKFHNIYPPFIVSTSLFYVYLIFT
jgi:hypothetical protein